MISVWIAALVGALLVLGWLLQSYWSASGDARREAGPTEPFRDVLAEIEADTVSGKLSVNEAEVAKAELAREVLRARHEAHTSPKQSFGPGMMVTGALLIVGLTVGGYATHGSPHLPGRPLAERTEATGYESLVQRIESHLLGDPDDADGWRALATLRMEMGAFEQAAEAYRTALGIGPATADGQTDLAEALLFLGSGAARAEAMELLRSAATSDETHVRSRLYLASELTRAGEKDEAIQRWQQAMEMAAGDEPWLDAARQGLVVARGGGDATLVDEAEMISGMVEGLHARLFADGGSLEEWTQLVRSYLVLNDPASAQRSYDAAVLAYPLASVRQDLDALASDAGLATEGEGE
ncbi:c-type cytochrome biogenesis protein CcmI [Devosia sp. XJ19-1]|uniref:c-type cytochrome biogenesis protein CcmI n=1 Tax=Devosia ureilytica TaxID=2952754 RepID=UPI0020C77552|nr:c-type cytochrome biogenesis protein CcmI [Devosia ureilytica]MCP8885057.1 c-type cytochrome biogenesis protein CcmI [Devosia ureilytica]